MNWKCFWGAHDWGEWAWRPLTDGDYEERFCCDPQCSAMESRKNVWARDRQYAAQKRGGQRQPATPSQESEK